MSSVSTEEAVKNNGTASKIGSFSSLKPGWIYGGGVAFESRTILNATNLLNAALDAGFSKTDAFPGDEGDITVAIYIENDYYGFTIDANEGVCFLHERGIEEIDCSEGLSMEAAVEKIKTLPGTCNLSAFSISPNTTKLVVVSGALHSKSPVVSMVAEYQLLRRPAPSLEVVQFAPIFENFIQVLPQILTQEDLRKCLDDWNNRLSQQS